MIPWYIGVVRTASDDFGLNPGWLKIGARETGATANASAENSPRFRRSVVSTDRCDNRKRHRRRALIPFQRIYHCPELAPFMGGAHQSTRDGRE